MATDLGKVGIVMKGTWSSSATYEVLDAVSYNNGLYIAKQAVPANTLPTNTTYWQVAVDMGYPKTAVGVTAESDFTIETNKSYRIGDVVYLNLYISTPTAVTTRIKCASIDSSAMNPPVVIRYCGAAAPALGNAASLINTGYINTSGEIFVGDNASNGKSFSIVLAYVL